MKTYTLRNIRNFVLITICLFTTSLSAQLASNETITIKGGFTCHEWQKARSTDRSQIFEGYVQGYLNGYALGADIDLWKEPHDITPEMFFSALDAHCSNKLFDDVVTAIHDLLIQRGNLPKKM